MPNIVLSSNLFLEQQELNQIIRFLGEDGYKNLFRSIIKSYGIVFGQQKEFEGISEFQINSNSTNDIIISSGLAIDKNLNFIFNSQSVTKTVSNPGDGTSWWIKISHAYKNTERGTIAVSADGGVLGIGTEFTKVLRGQPNYPTKIKLTNSANAQEYEVVKVIDDTTAIIVGPLVAESNKQYSVVGCFTPGFQPAPDKNQIYQYDDCIITLINDGTRPPLVEGMEFLLAQISYDSNGVRTITDLRQNYAFNSDNYSATPRPTSNPLCSLKKWMYWQNGLVGWGFEFDHGYRATSFTLSGDTANGFSINILSGNSNAVPAVIPNDFFKGWKWFVDGNPGNSEVITSSIGNTIKFPNLFITPTSGVDTIVIVPNYTEIEYELTYFDMDNNVQYSPIYQRVGMENSILIAPLPLFPVGVQNHRVKIRYRMIQDTQSTGWLPLMQANFLDGDGQPDTMPATSSIELWTL